MQIRAINKRIYTTDEVHTLATLVLRQVNAWKGKDSLVGQLCSEIHDANVELAQAMGNRSKNTQTMALSEADRQRDTAFRVFYKYVEICTMLQDKQIRLAAEKVMSHLEKIDRNLHNLGYARQSTDLEVLFEEMNKVESQLDTMNGEYWLAELKKAEKVFQARKKGKLKEELDKSSILPVIEARETAIELLNALVDTLNAMALTKVEGIKDLNARVDRVIQDVEVPAKSCLSRRANDDDEEDNLDLPATVQDVLAIDLD